MTGSSPEDAARQAGQSAIGRTARALGGCIAALAAAWIIWQFLDGDVLATLAHVHATGARLAVAAALAVLSYAAGCGLLTVAWWRLLSGLNATAPPVRATMATWAVSQFGRYLPGNVAHFMLRHAWSRRYQIDHSVLVVAAMLEAALLLVVALALSFELARPWIVASWPQVNPSALLFLAGAAVIAACGGLRWAARRGSFASMRFPRIEAPPIIVAGACDVAYFLACGTAMFALVQALAPGAASFATLLGVAAASWAAGFVVIGAPAGIGIREAVIVALCTPQLGADNALLLAAIYRVATFTGDVLVFAVGLLLARTPYGISR